MKSTNLVFCALLLCLPAFAQFQGPEMQGLGLQGGLGAADMVSIQGTIYGSIGTQQCTLELRSADSAVAVQQTSCNLNSFDFDNVPRGIYIVVLHVGTAEVKQQINAEMLSNSVDLHLPQQPTQVAEGTVSVQEMLIPSKARNLLRKASDLMHDSKLNQAEEKLQEALTIAPKFPRAMALQAVIFAHDKNLNAALQAANTAVSLDAQLPFAQFVRAMVLNARGNFQQALAAADQGLRLDGNSWQGHFEKAHALYQMGDMRQAFSEVVQAQRTAPKDFTDLRVLKTMLLLNSNLLGQAKHEVAELRKVAAHDPRVEQLSALLASRAGKK